MNSGAGHNKTQSFSTINKMPNEDQIPHTHAMHGGVDGNYQTFLNGQEANQYSDRDDNQLDHTDCEPSLNNMQINGEFSNQYQMNNVKLSGRSKGAPQIGKTIPGVRLKVNKISNSGKNSLSRQSLTSLDKASPGMKQPVYLRQGSNSSLQGSGTKIKAKQQKLFMNSSGQNQRALNSQNSQPRLFSNGQPKTGSGMPVVRKSGASGLPKGGSGSRPRASSAIASK